MWTLGIWEVKSARDTGQNFTEHITGFKMAASASTHHLEQIIYYLIYKMPFSVGACESRNVTGHLLLVNHFCSCSRKQIHAVYCKSDSLHCVAYMLNPAGNRALLIDVLIIKLQTNIITWKGSRNNTDFIQWTLKLHFHISSCLGDAHTVHKHLGL